MAISGTMASGAEESLSEAVVSIDLGDSGTYVAISTWSASVDVAGGETPIAEQPRLSGSTIVGTGRRGARTVTVTCLYTEEATGPFNNIYDAYDAGNLDCDIKYTKPGATTGDNEFETVEGKLTSCSLPLPNASEANPATFTFTLSTQQIDRNEL
jgi:hypothetical protein